MSKPGAEKLEKDRISEIVKAIQKVARGDYSVQIELSGKNDDLDSLAIGINMMIDDLRELEEVRKKYGKKLEEKVKARTIELQSKIKELDRIRLILYSLSEDIQEEKEKVDIKVKERTEELQEEQAFTENIVNTMPVSLVVINSDGKIGSVNKTTCELLEYTEEELVGQPIERVFNHAIRGVILKGGGSEGLIKGVTIKDKQLIFRTKKEEEIPLAISESVVKDKEGKLKYIVMVAQDLREILKLEEEKRKAEVVAVEKEIKSLKELDRLKDEFLNIAAHELKTPLTSIVSLSEMLKEQKPFFDSQHEKYINIIHEEGDRLTHIVRRILTVTRYESARETVYSEPFSSISFVSSLLPNLNMLAEKKKSRIVIEREKGDMVIESDKEKISQVIYNFVDNAVKYGPEGQTITIAITKPEKDWVKIEVKDQGPGIPPTLQKRLFIKFSQLEPSLSRTQEGTGLGLYICKLIIDKLGGKIGVKSRMGEGSTFYFTLPVFTKRI